jgi:hypothetical protein
VLVATVAAPGGGAAKIAGLRAVMIAFELKKMLFTARLGFAGGKPANWSFLAEPLRPALVSLLPPLVMTVATKAATAKHARIILREERVMMVYRKGKKKVQLVFERHEKDWGWVK